MKAWRYGFRAGLKVYHSSLLLELHYPISKVPQPFQFTNKENQNPEGSLT